MEESKTYVREKFREYLVSPMEMKTSCILSPKGKKKERKKNKSWPCPQKVPRNIDQLRNNVYC